MKRFIALAVLLTSGLVLSAAAQTLSAPARTQAPAKPAKVAVISFQAAVAQTNEGQRNIGDLQSKFAPKRQQLQARSAELEAMAKQLQTQSGTLSEAEAAKRSKDLGDKKKAFDRDAEDAQNDVQTEMQDLFTTLAPKVYKVLVSYAEQQGYTVVMDIPEQQGPVLYASDSTDITKAVVDAYNLKSGIPAPAAQRSAPSAPAKSAPKAPVTH